MRFTKLRFRRCSREEIIQVTVSKGDYRKQAYFQLAKKTKLLDLALCNGGRRRDPIPSSAEHLPLLLEKRRRHGASHGIKELEEQHRTGIASS